MFDYAKLKDEKSGNLRYFWNGNFSSSSPLNELISSHKEFWKEHGSQELGEKFIPELEVYMVNVWPYEEQHIPYDHDGITDRRNDMIFHGRGPYDQKIAIIISDYINLARRLEELVLKHANEIKNADKRDEVRGDLKRLLHTETLSTFHRNKEFTLYLDLIREQCIVKKVVCIQREDEFNLTSNYWLRSFWQPFIKSFLEGGYEQARKKGSEIRRTSLLP
jgi:NTE family protein